MDQLSKHKELDSSSTSNQNASSDADLDSTSDSTPANSTGENSPAEQRKWTYSKASTDSTDLGSSQTSKAKEEPETKQIMSSYKPRVRPASRILNAVANAQQQSSREAGGNPGPLSITATSVSSGTPKMADVVEQKMKDEAAIKSQGMRFGFGVILLSTLVNSNFSLTRNVCWRSIP